jgi:hypothetical protein
VPDSGATALFVCFGLAGISLAIGSQRSKFPTV